MRNLELTLAIDLCSERAGFVLVRVRGLGVRGVRREWGPKSTVKIHRGKAVGWVGEVVD